MSRRPGHLLQVNRARGELVDFIQRWEFEIAAESTPRHLKNVATACRLLLEHMIRIQGNESLETRAFELKLKALAIRSERLWGAEPEAVVKKARPTLRLVH